jgi:hypothetical protein
MSFKKATGNTLMRNLVLTSRIKGRVRVVGWILKHWRSKTSIEPSLWVLELGYYVSRLSLSKIKICWSVGVW